jgi:hypothetical protein
VIAVDETALGVANFVLTKSFVSRVRNKNQVMHGTFTKNGGTVSGARWLQANVYPICKATGT